jgi:DNA-binding IclR family transcriptional regulator
MAGNSTDPGRSVTSKVTAILTAFGDGAVLTLTEVAGIAHLPTSTAHRLASELLAWRLLERTDQGGYRIGLPLRIIGKDAADFDVLNRAILIMQARPVLDELAWTIGTDAKLGTLLDDEIVYLGHSGPSATGAASLTPPLPAHATAIGKALVAFSPTSVIDRILAEARRTAKTMTAADEIRQELSVIRLTQVATARDELQCGRSAIAVPVFRGGGKVGAAIELAIREPGIDVTVATGALTVACRSLSRQLATEFRDQGTDRTCGHQNETAV